LSFKQLLWVSQHQVPLYYHLSLLGHFYQKGISYFWVLIRNKGRGSKIWDTPGFIVRTCAL
jgi:hypothetical protein